MGMRNRAGWCAVLVLAGGMASAVAQERRAAGDFPNRPIRLVVPFTPGGTNDILARLFSAKLAELRNWNVLVENKPGAGSAIGAAFVAAAPPDGYNLLAISSSHTVVAVAQKLPYDPVRSFTALNLIGTGANVLTVAPNFPASNIAELIALARARPGQYSFASSGLGSLTHLMGEQFNAAARINTLHVAYKGGTPAVTDVMSGQVHLYYSGLAAVMPLVRAGKMKALGVTTPERSPAAPEVAAIAETVPGFQAPNWYGILGPAALPAGVTGELNGAFNQVLRDAEVVKRLTSEGIQPANATPEAAAKFLADDAARWGNIARSVGIAPQ